MKKQILLFIVSLVVTLSVAFFVIRYQKQLADHDHLTNLPDPKLHPHVSPDGETVSHIHHYDAPIRDKSTVTPKGVQPNSTSQNKKKHRVQKAWEKLDLTAIKRDWQPYTIAEMNDMWWDNEFGVHWKKHQGWIDDVYPNDTWLQRYLDLGYPFLSGSNYRTALNQRSSLHSRYNRFHNLEPRDPLDPSNTEKGLLLSELGIPRDAEITWEEYEDLFIKSKVIAANIFEQEYRSNPNYIGGTVSATGDYIPFSQDTIYVHISENTEYARVIGAILTPEEIEDLTIYGVAPPEMHVIYRDENGNSLPADAPTPRFYERRMKELEQAEAAVEQIIADHQAFFNSLPEAMQEDIQEGLMAPSDADLHNNMHPHTHSQEESNRKDNTQRSEDLNPKMKAQYGRLPSDILSPELQTPNNIEELFVILQELHGGDLPKDLQGLQKIIKQLDVIRQAGEKKVPKPSNRPQERPTQSNQ